MLSDDLVDQAKDNSINLAQRRQSERERNVAGLKLGLKRSKIMNRSMKGREEQGKKEERETKKPKQVIPLWEHIVLGRVDL